MVKSKPKYGLFLNILGVNRNGLKGAILALLTLEVKEMDAGQLVFCPWKENDLERNKSGKSELNPLLFLHFQNKFINMF